MNKIINYHSRTVLTNYKLGDCPILEKKLSIWNKIYFKWIGIGYRYDDKNNELIIPSGVNLFWVSKLTERPIEVEYNYDPLLKIPKYEMKVQPRDKLQQDALDFLNGRKRYKDNSSYSQLVLNMDTGKGKTFVTINTILTKKIRTLIIVNSNQLKSQWKEKILEYTNIPDERIKLLSGRIGCLEIMAKDNNYDIFITTHDTIRSFGDSEGWDKVTQLLKSMKIGLKVYDEAHLEFQNILRVDSYSNTKYTYYLTATFARSDPSENYVFKTVFSSIPIFNNISLTDKKDYIVYLPFIYNSKPSIYDLSKIKNNFGFNRIKYSNYQIKKDEQFFEYILKLVALFGIQKDMKILILTSLIEGIEEIRKVILSAFPELDVSIYHSKMKRIDKEKSINSKIIISTSKSLGVGTDINDLRVVINTESYKSKVITRQIIGRLRKPIDEEQCYYIEVVDGGFQTLRLQQKTREKEIKKIVGAIYHVKHL